MRADLQELKVGQFTLRLAAWENGRLDIVALGPPDGLAVITALQSGGVELLADRIAVGATVTLSIQPSVSVTPGPPVPGHNATRR